MQLTPNEPAPSAPSNSIASGPMVQDQNVLMGNGNSDQRLKAELESLLKVSLRVPLLEVLIKLFISFLAGPSQR